MFWPGSPEWRVVEAQWQRGNSRLLHDSSDVDTYLWSHRQMDRNLRQLHPTYDHLIHTNRLLNVNAVFIVKWQGREPKFLSLTRPHCYGRIQTFIWYKVAVLCGTWSPLLQISPFDAFRHLALIRQRHRQTDRQATQLVRKAEPLAYTTVCLIMCRRCFCCRNVGSTRVIWYQHRTGSVTAENFRKYQK